MHSSTLHSSMRKPVTALVAIFCLCQYVLAATFSDVSDEHRHAVAIEALHGWDIISGYADGTFRPDAVLNRAEALKILLTSAGIESPERTDQSAVVYADVALTDWFARYVLPASQRGIVSGNPDGSFAPARQVNKAEYIKMMLEAFDIDLSAHYDAASLSADTSGDEWFIPYLSYAKTIGITTPDLDNRLHPAMVINRGESAEMVYKMIIVLRGGDAQKLLSIAESNIVSILVSLNQGKSNEALTYADSATFYTEKVLAISPDDTIAQGADKIARAFKKLCLAYQAAKQSEVAALAEHVAAAKTLGDEAVTIDLSFGEFRDYIYAAGDTLLGGEE